MSRTCRHLLPLCDTDLSVLGSIPRPDVPDASNEIPADKATGLGGFPQSLEAWLVTLYQGPRLARWGVCDAFTHWTENIGDGDPAELRLMRNPWSNKLALEVIRYVLTCIHI